MAPYFIHPQALVESEAIGEGTRIWAFAHILEGASVGNNCNICDQVFMESGSKVGNNVTIKNQVCLWEGVTVEDDCFIGPHVVFTNDQYPRSPRMDPPIARYETREGWLLPTIVETGCSIGANSTILPGIRLGAFCMIAAGSTVTSNVKPHALMMGSPARQVGWVCRCGVKIENIAEPSCSECGTMASDLVA